MLSLPIPQEVPDLADEPDAGLTGAAYELANAGYVPMSDPDKKNEDEAIGSDTGFLARGAEQRSAPREFRVDLTNFTSNKASSPNPVFLSRTIFSGSQFASI